MIKLIYAKIVEVRSIGSTPFFLFPTPIHTPMNTPRASVLVPDGQHCIVTKSLGFGTSDLCWISSSTTH